MSDFEKIIAYDSLLSAHIRARKCKQHKREVIQFELNLSQNLWALHYDLKYHRYTIGSYNKFKIYDPKEREIQAITYRDRIVQHALCDEYLTPLLERHLIDANCACRRGKGTDYAIKLLRRFMTAHYKHHGKSGYFIKLDVHKFFPSINHDVLKRKLWRIVTDAEIQWLLETVIDSFPENGCGVGLPMGNQSSQNFALLYLDVVDRFIKEQLKVKFYVRYMDDMILFVESKERARKVFQLVSNVIQAQNVEVNPKSGYFPVSRGIEFLGWRFFYGKNGQIIQKVKNQSKQRMFRKTKFQRFLVCCGQKSEKELLCSLASYRGHLFRGNGWRVYKKLLVTY